MVVRDKKGRLVKNLKQGDIQVFEDGVHQQILSFRVASRDPKRRQESRPKLETAGGASLPLRELNTICIVFHNIGPVTRPHAIEIVKEFIRSSLPPESYIGIFNLNEKLAVVQGFTKNREELLNSPFSIRTMDFNKASVALLTASPNIVTLNVQVNAATHSATVAEDMTGGEVSNAVIMGADVSNSAGAKCGPLREVTTMWTLPTRKTADRPMSIGRLRARCPDRVKRAAKRLATPTSALTGVDKCALVRIEPVRGRATHDGYIIGPAGNVMHDILAPQTGQPVDSWQSSADVLEGNMIPLSHISFKGTSGDLWNAYVVVR